MNIDIQEDVEIVINSLLKNVTDYHRFFAKYYFPYTFAKRLFEWKTKDMFVETKDEGTYHHTVDKMINKIYGRAIMFDDMIVAYHTDNLTDERKKQVKQKYNDIKNVMVERILNETALLFPIESNNYPLVLTHYEIDLIEKGTPIFKVIGLPLNKSDTFYEVFFKLMDKQYSLLWEHPNYKFNPYKVTVLVTPPSVSNQNVPMSNPFQVSEHVKMFDELLNDNYANFVKGIDGNPVIDYGNAEERHISSIDAYKKGINPNFRSIHEPLKAVDFINMDLINKKEKFDLLSNLFEKDGFTCRRWVIISDPKDRIEDWIGTKSLYSDLENAIKHPERFTKSYQQEKVVSNELETIYDFDEVGQSYYAIFREMRHYIDVIKEVSKTYGHDDSTPSVSEPIKESPTARAFFYKCLNEVGAWDIPTEIQIGLKTLGIEHGCGKTGESLYRAYLKVNKGNIGTNYLLQTIKMLEKHYQNNQNDAVKKAIHYAKSIKKH
jgi:hypothetical protein